MSTITTPQNWVISEQKDVLRQIHQQDINISILERNTSSLSEEIDRLMRIGIELNATGTTNDILNTIRQTPNADSFGNLIEDIRELLDLFHELSKATSLRFLLASVNTNMCRRFHTDINDLRLLCTYSGPGTLWLPEDNINRKALDSCGDNECIVLDEERINQVKTGAVAILKGAIYPKKGTKAIVHRSPTIEESVKKRLLLRIDTNEFLNF